MHQLARRLNINAAATDFSKSGRLVDLRQVYFGIADLHPDIFGPTNRADNSVRLNKPETRLTLARLLNIIG